VNLLWGYWQSWLVIVERMKYVGGLQKV
jgi:hypothetical protein